MNKLKLELKNKNNSSQNKELFSLDQMMCVHFISMDQRVHYAAPCIKTNTFAEIEEKLYKQYPQFRETNNFFISNGAPILRFKTIGQNNIISGTPVILLVPIKN